MWRDMDEEKLQEALLKTPSVLNRLQLTSVFARREARKSAHNKFNLKQQICFKML